MLIRFLTLSLVASTALIGLTHCSGSSGSNPPPPTPPSRTEGLRGTFTVEKTLSKYDYNRYSPEQELVTDAGSIMQVVPQSTESKEKSTSSYDARSNNRITVQPFNKMSRAYFSSVFRSGVVDAELEIAESLEWSGADSLIWVSIPRKVTPLPYADQSNRYSYNSTLKIDSYDCASKEYAEKLTIPEGGLTESNYNWSSADRYSSRRCVSKSDFTDAIKALDEKEKINYPLAGCSFSEYKEFRKESEELGSFKVAGGNKSYPAVRSTTTTINLTKDCLHANWNDKKVVMTYVSIKASKFRDLKRMYIAKPEVIASVSVVKVEDANATTLMKIEKDELIEDTSL